MSPYAVRKRNPRNPFAIFDRRLNSLASYSTLYDAYHSPYYEPDTARILRQDGELFLRLSPDEERELARLWKQDHFGPEAA